MAFARILCLVLSELLIVCAFSLLQIVVTQLNPILSNEYFAVQWLWIYFVSIFYGENYSLF